MIHSAINIQTRPKPTILDWSCTTRTVSTFLIMTKKIKNYTRPSFLQFKLKKNGNVVISNTYSISICLWLIILLLWRYINIMFHYFSIISSFVCDRVPFIKYLHEQKLNNNKIYIIQKHKQIQTVMYTTWCI